jgi:hypothetical protein
LLSGVPLKANQGAELPGLKPFQANSKQFKANQTVFLSQTAMQRPIARPLMTDYRLLFSAAETSPGFTIQRASGLTVERFNFLNDSTPVIHHSARRPLTPRPHDLKLAYAT